MKCFEGGEGLLRCFCRVCGAFMLNELGDGEPGYVECNSRCVMWLQFLVVNRGVGCRFMKYQRPSPTHSSPFASDSSDGTRQIFSGASVRFVVHAFVLADTLSVEPPPFIGFIKRDGFSIRSCDLSMLKKQGLNASLCIYFYEIAQRTCLAKH